MIIEKHFGKHANIYILFSAGEHFNFHSISRQYYDIWYLPLTFMKWGSMKSRKLTPVPGNWCFSAGPHHEISYDREIWIYTQWYLRELHQSESVWQRFWHAVSRRFELMSWSRASSQNDWHGPLALELNVWAWNSQHRSMRALWAQSHPLAYSWSDEHTHAGMCLHVLCPPLYLWSSPQKLSH